MKMVAAAKLRRAQENIEKARPYAQKLGAVLGQLASSVDRESHPLLAVRPVQKIGLVVVTADRGLCGGFNTNIIRKATAVMKTYGDLEYGAIAVGRKGRDQLRRQEVSFYGEYINIFRTLEFYHAQQIAGQIMQKYLEKSFDRVDIIYNEFKSAVQQNVIVSQLLPIEEIGNQGEKSGIDYLFEPDGQEVIDSLLPLHLNIQLWRILLESNAAEQGARMTAMESATDNAQEMIEQLTLLYNRTRQMNITKEITEIVGGAEALK